MSPATSRPSAGRRVDQGRHRRRARSRPSGAPPPRSPPRAPAHRGSAGDLGAQLGAVDRLPAPDPRRELPHLVALQLPEEVPPRAASTRGVLRQQLLGAVLADVDDAGVDDRSDAAASTVLVAADQRRPPGRARRAPPRPRSRSRTSATRRGDRSRSRVAHDDDGLASGDAVAPVGEVVGRRRRCTRRRRRGRRPRARAARSARGGDVERRRAVGGRARRPRGRTARRAGRAGRRRTRSGRGARRARATRATGPGDDRARAPRPRAPMHTLLEPRPAGVDDADRAGARQRDRRAVGGEHHERQARRSW